MVAFRYPFEAPTLPALALRIVSGDWSPPPSGVSDDLIELISTLLTKEQRSRPAMEEVLALPVVRSRITRFENEMRRLWPMGGGGSGAPTPTQPDLNGDARAGAAVDAACAAAASFSLPPELAQRAPGATAAGTSPPPANGSMALPVAAGSVSWPLEPTPLEVSAAERELVAAAFAEADEPLLCLCAVQRVNEVCCCCAQRAVVVSSQLLLCPASCCCAQRKKGGERVLGVGTHRLLVLSPKRRVALVSGASRLRVCFWHELLSCSGSADDGTRLRLTFVPQQTRLGALPPLFRARLSGSPQQVHENEMWQLTLEVCDRHVA